VWTIAVLIGLALWVTAIVVTGTRADPSDADATKPAIVGGGAVFFLGVFSAAAIGIARSTRREPEALFDRLALTTVPKGAIRAMGRRSRLIGYGYVVFGALITGLGLAVVAVGDAERARPLFLAMMIVLGLWLVLMVVALWQAVTMSGEVFAPLGLALTGLPSVHVSVIAERTWLTGAVSYAGVRHGRSVSITQNVKGAATLLGLERWSDRPGSIPSTPGQMAALTGKPVRCWRHVEVAVEQGVLLVVRTGNAAGGWMLHDLLLAEAIADAGV
jgi:hypothetical protein